MTIMNAKYVVCINNDCYPASLEVRKIYRTLPDEIAAMHSLIRVIDESDESYLYPVGWFVPIELTKAAAEALYAAA